MTIATTINPARVRAFRLAADKMREAARLLAGFEGDPRVAGVVCQLEGIDLGWEPFDGDYLVDTLHDLWFEATGGLMHDDWKECFVTRALAEAGVVASIDPDRRWLYDDFMGGQ